MKIVIVGAGLGGLSAALCFARRGHDVQLFEQRSTLSPQGSGINIRPGATRIMHTWGLENDLEAIGESTPSVLLKDLASGKIAVKTVVYDVSSFPDFGTNREVLIKFLHHRAVIAGAKLRFGSTVQEVYDNAHKAFLKLEDGALIDADLVLAADGVRSRIRQRILADIEQHLTSPLLSDTTFYGIKLPAAAVLGKSGLLPLTDQSYLNVFMGAGGFVVARWNSTLQTWGALYGIKASTDQQGLWDENGNLGYVRDFYKDSCFELTEALRLAEACDRWKLCEMPDLPRWTSKAGRIALLGDSAHAMHPNAAQGYSQIIEDIGVLEHLITRIAEPEAQIPELISIWQDIRKPRVERIKAWAKWNTQLFLNAGNDLEAGPAPTVRRGEQQSTTKSLKETIPDMHAPFKSSAFLKWAQDYDAVGEAEKYLKQQRSRL